MKATRGFTFLMVFVLAALVLSTVGLLTAANWLDRGLAVRSMRLVTEPGLRHVTRWIISEILLGVSIVFLGCTRPNLRRQWPRVMPGVAFVVVGWLVSTAGFNLDAQSGGAANHASRRGWACPALVLNHGHTTRAGQAQPLRDAQNVC